jgi:ATP-dependent Clp protease ATP-binding subunit ClpA
MYERFTDRARKVMQLANQEAKRLNHEYVGTEHILLGLVQEEVGVAADVFKNRDIDLRMVREEVEKIVQTGPGSEMVTMGKLPTTPRAKKVIEYAIKETRELGSHSVGTEHLLLGLLREGDGVAAQVLMNLGLKLEDIREEVLNLLGINPDRPPGRNDAGGQLQRRQDYLESLYCVSIAEDAMTAAVDLSGRYLSDRGQEPTVFNVIAQACKEVRHRSTTLPPVIQWYDAEIEQLHREREDAIAAQDSEKLVWLSRDTRTLIEQRGEAFLYWRRRSPELSPVVRPADVAAVVNRMAGPSGTDPGDSSNQ